MPAGRGWSPEDQALIRNLELSARPLQPPKRGEKPQAELIINVKDPIDHAHTMEPP